MSTLSLVLDPTTLTRLQLPGQLPLSKLLHCLDCPTCSIFDTIRVSDLRSRTQSAEVSESVATGDNKALLKNCCIYMDLVHSVDGHGVAEGWRCLSDTVRRS